MGKKKRIKIGWALRPGFDEAVRVVAERFTTYGIADCVEAAILMFSHASREEQKRYLDMIRDADEDGNMGSLLNFPNPNHPTAPRLAASPEVENRPQSLDKLKRPGGLHGPPKR
jgi:hypothetical protein